MHTNAQMLQNKVHSYRLNNLMNAMGQKHRIQGPELEALLRGLSKVEAALSRDIASVVECAERLEANFESVAKMLRELGIEGRMRCSKKGLKQLTVQPPASCTGIVRDL